MIQIPFVINSVCKQRLCTVLVMSDIFPVLVTDLTGREPAITTCFQDKIIDGMSIGIIINI